MTLLLPEVWSYLLLSFAFTTRVRLHGASSHGDFSYGVYLYAFVVPQAVAALFPVGHRPLALFATALPITFGCAWLSWNYVEAPFMRRKAISPHLFEPRPRTRFRQREITRHFIPFPQQTPDPRPEACHVFLQGEI